jgi:transcriptional regulator with XRE-family HTH domain
VSGTNEGVEALAAVVADARRKAGGISIQALAEVAGFKSQQALQQKLTGRVRFQPPELVRLAEALDLDAVYLIGVYWPEVAQADRVPAELRRVMARATPGQRRSIVTEARRVTGTGRPISLTAATHANLRGAAGDGAAKLRKGKPRSRPSPPSEDTPET